MFKHTHSQILLLATAIALFAPGPRPAAQSSFEIVEASIHDIQDALLSKQVTTGQIVRLYLDRIKAYNGPCVGEPYGILGPITPIANAGQLNALITLNLRPESRKALGFDDRKARSMTDLTDANPAMPDALETAAAQDRELARTGKLAGPLHGAVIALKDQYDTFDMRTTSGADAFYANDRPPRDATFVKRLRDAGAIILAKANLAEYAGGRMPRSSFGGTSCNPYDTTRTPSGSSSGSGSSVAANLVTCAIAEETTSSVRGPARAGSTVGLSPTQELISRDGMSGMSINTRVGPICRTVPDVARVLDVIAGYDPKDPLTVFAIDRTPSRPYQTFAQEKSLTGIRIGVVREYMDKSLFNKSDEETIDLVERGAADLEALGATIVDPGPGGALFTGCIRQYAPRALNKLFTRRFPDQFPVDDQGRPAKDHVATLIDMAVDPSLVPDTMNLREFGNAGGAGEGKYSMNLYLRERGDASIRSNTDLATKSNFHNDPKYPNRREQRQNADTATEMNMADRMLFRFAFQEVMLQCMAEQQLDALIYPTTNLPPPRLGSPDEPVLNGRSDAWNAFGQQGFPAITVPAGFTTAVYETVDGKFIGPVPAKLPVGMDILGKPFAEPLLLRIASAYETATKHRLPPPAFGPVSKALNSSY